MKGGFKMSNVLKIYGKRILSTILVGIFALLQAIGISFDIGGVHNGLYGWFSYDFAYSTEKVMQGDLLGKDKTFDIKLAKNEREACQFLMRERIGSEEATVEFGAFTNTNGDVLSSEIYLENYINVGTSNDFFYGTYPDALVPYTTKEMDFNRHVNTAFYIEVRSDENTPAGTYTSTITVTTRDEKQNFTVTLTATVWDFTLPEAPAMDTAMGIFGSNFFELNGFTGNVVGINGGTVASLSESARALYQQYYDMLLDHGISAYTLPYDILDVRANAYMSDPRVTSFCIPYSGNDTILKAYYKKVSDNPEWAKKGFFYPIDEPRTSANMATYEAMTTRLANLCPGYNMVTPFFSTEITDDETGEIVRNFEMQCGRSNILCPETVCYDQESDFYDRVQERVAVGDKSWWYVCCGPNGTTDYCNMFTFQSGLKHRILFWQQRQKDVTGLLYWSTAYWDKCGNPWYNSKTWDDTSSSGDGSWFYPGKTVGINGPVGSLRLKGAANGIEDYDYFTLAENLLGEEYVEKMISKVTTSLTRYTDSDKKFDTVRTALGDAIAAAQ